MTSITSFLHEARYIILFYILGDLVTTYIALTHGAYEVNPFLTSYGLTLILKLAFLCLLSLVYISLKRWPTSWNVCKHTIAGLGVLATLSNIAVIFSGYSLFQLTGVV